MAFDYQHTSTVRHWDWTGCSHPIDVPWGIKWCKKWGIPYPCGIKWKTIDVPYPCYVTTQVTESHLACRGSGGKVAQLLSNLPPASRSKYPDTAPPVADPLAPDGDTLYAVYRKGLITRHVTRNGRVLAQVALEKLNFDPNTYDNSGYVGNRSNGRVIRIPIGNARYSEEIVPGTSNSEKVMWIPVVAPTKYPGFENSGYYVISGNDDNPFYYSGGLALATFSLEAIHGVSEHSIEYARRLVLYFLTSEMWEGNGYIIRKPGFFNSNRNRNGESIIQGASAEELLGVMLGLMFYLKAEDPGHSLYLEALNLRDRVLTKISKGPLFVPFSSWDNYKHSFMNSSKDPNYKVKHFEFALYAPREYKPGTWPGVMEQYYISTLTLGSGKTRTAAKVASWLIDKLPLVESGPPSFQDYMMFITSMILVLEGNLPENKKEWFAEVFMRDVIKASKTWGPDIANLEGNLYMSVVGLLANKYLNDQRDSWRHGEKLNSIWGDKMDVWRHMKSHPVPFPQYSSLQASAPAPAGMQWQHNLPLLKNESGTLGWVDRNPTKGIGRHFVWRYGSGSYEWKTEDEDKWLEDFSGWDNRNEFVTIAPSDKSNENDLTSSTYKAYSNKNYVEQEIIATRGSNDNQVEGAGLGLLLVRMLLTHGNPERYPKPELPEEYDKSFPVLPFVGAEPMSPQLMYSAYRYKSKSDCTPFEIHGDQDQSLRIIELGDGSIPSKNFVVAYAGDDEKLVLKHGFVSHGTSNGLEIGLYLDSKGTTWKRFDKAVIASTVNDMGANILIVAERAEGKRTKNPFSRCFLRRKHWLRMSMWMVPSFADGQDPNPVNLSFWASGNRHCNAVKEIDMALLGNNHVAVIFRTRNDNDRIRIFEIKNTINPVYNSQVANEVFDKRIKVTTSNNHVVYSRQHASGWRLHCSVWDGNSLVDKAITSLQHSEMLDITTVPSGGRQYLVAVTKQEGYLRIYSYEILSDGTLPYKGEFHTIDGEKILVGREADYDRASISSFTYANKAGFVIVGKGVAREIKRSNGDRKKSAKGLKLLYGHILDDGRPTIVTSGVLGSGESSAMRMLDVTGHMSDGNFHGVVTAHKTKKYGGFLGIGAKHYLNLTFWQYRDPYLNHRFP